MPVQPYYNLDNSEKSNTSSKIDIQADTIFAKYLKPILGKLILILVIVVLLLIVINIFIKSLKKDHTLELMQQKIELQEQQRKDILQDRLQLELLLKQSNQKISEYNKKDSLLLIKIDQIGAIVSKINTNYNEKIKVIEHYNSADLQLYYQQLPNDY